MKITFVGTSHGVPGPDRFCSCIMLESGGKVYFIDAGAPVADMILRYGKNVNDFRAMFITHTHSDHTAGILHFSSLISWYYLEAEGDFYLTTEGHIDATKIYYESVGGKFDDARVRFKLACEGLVYQDENIKVEYIKTEHIPNSYAILVTEGEKRVLFGGDFSQHIAKDDVPSVVKEPIDAFVCEMAHFNMEELKPHLETCRAKRVFFTHVWPLRKYDDIRAIEGAYPFEVIAPADGDAFEI